MISSMQTHISFDDFIYGIDSIRLSFDARQNYIDRVVRFNDEGKRESLYFVDIEEILSHVNSLGHLKETSERSHYEIDAAIICIRSSCFIEHQTFFLYGFRCPSPEDRLGFVILF